MLRLQVLSGHLAPGSRQQRPRSQSVEAGGAEQDVVLVHGVRTAIGKANRGSFKDTKSDELLSAVLLAVLRDVNLDPHLLGDICVGNILQPGAGALMARVAQFLSGIPESVPVYCVNRQCSSGLQALINIAVGIRNGSYDIGLACGVESLSQRTMGDSGHLRDISSRMMDNEKARSCLIPMGITSENVAERFGISREKQDSFAAASQQKAAQAQRMGLFDAEITPVKTTILDSAGNSKTITVTQDDGIRASTTVAGLSKLRPVFKENGTTTAGNSSQVSDGAAAVLVARRSKAIELGLPILGVLRSYAVVGVPPDIMGIGPAYAIPAALEKAGLTINDIDVFEINEAFASQALYCVEKLGIPIEKVNPNGGAIALGHPLGCTGARQIVTLLNELKWRGRRAYGVVSTCMGTGMGAAAVFEYPAN
ncbi:LOW QUALITY PROTEIN: 3-ketoacyl-CoA thiolase, peroxisomal [Rhincodon typus]|uniref:LOW QUALITY PROTEIN: 3-ketoacyl-CoA thiolase, peroxisomal n=1 Tax=Rhincodon typus TaxID=259920 RepID=UPI00202F3CEE|nr:LOW QUALITY PROTEIN: 3-ketoacyl-CoA thiolase, peroxisomal [Rhincodon typus]